MINLLALLACFATMCYCLHRDFAFAAAMNGIAVGANLLVVIRLLIQ